MPIGPTLAFPLPFPISGIDRSLTEAKQQPLTCYDARNVRGTPPLTEKIGGGKRAGTRKAFGLPLSGRVTSVAASLRPAAAVPASNSNFEEINEYFDQYPSGNNSNKSGDRYTIYRFRGEPAFAGAVDTPTDTGVPVGLRSMADAGKVIFQPLNAPHPGVRIDPTALSGGVQYFTGFAVNAPTTNDVALTLIAARQQDTTSVAVEQLSNVGCFIRGSADLSNMLVARVTATAAPDEWALRLEWWDTTGVNVQMTTLATVTFSASAPSATQDNDILLTLKADPENVTCRLEWAGIGVAVELNRSSYTTGASNTRSGFICMQAVGGGNRIYRGFRYTRQVFKRPASVLQVVGSGKPAGASRYVVPAGCTAAIVRGFSDTFTAGDRQANSNTASSTSSQPAFPSLDTQPGSTGLVLIEGTPVTDRTTSVKVFTNTGGTPAAKTYAVDVYFRQSLNTANISDDAGVVIRMSADMRKMLVVRVTRQRDADTVLSANTHLLTLLLDKIDASAAAGAFTRTNLVTASITAIPPIFPMYTSAPLRVEDDGTTITIKMQGITLYSITNSVYNTQKGVGVEVNSAAGDAATLLGFNILDVTPDPLATATTPNVGETDVVAVTGGVPHVGVLGLSQTLMPIGPATFSNTLVQWAYLANRWYGVDGSKSIVVDPVNLTAVPYTVLQGVFPGGCALIAAWRGRIVLARQSTNPTMWYMARVLQPRDYNLGSTIDTKTKAYSGNDSAIGQPAEPITALAPYADDYLVIGCSGSLYMIEGDPGNGGTLNMLSNKTGIVGPRAWCYDHKGILYFVGAGDLMRLPRGSKAPESAARGRLAEIIKRLDPDQTLVQMSYNAAEQAVYIWMSPRATGAIGVHIVYCPETDSLWFDEFPTTDFGPWATCEIDGIVADNKTFLIGCNDGYIRRQDITGPADDGMEIDSWIRYTPTATDQSTDESIATELQFEGARGSGGLEWYWLTGPGYQQVNSLDFKTQAATKGSLALFGVGEQEPIGMRQTGAVHQLVLRQKSRFDRWAVEKVFASLAVSQRKRNTVKA